MDPAAAVAALFLIALLIPRTPPVKPVAVEAIDEPPPEQTQTQKFEPLKIKMLTPDPTVVIYWLIDN